jgi:hypothetical protein
MGMLRLLLGLAPGPKPRLGYLYCRRMNSSSGYPNKAGPGISLRNSGGLGTTCQSGFSPNGATFLNQCPAGRAERNDSWLVMVMLSGWLWGGAAAPAGWCAGWRG